MGCMAVTYTGFNGGEGMNWQFYPTKFCYGQLYIRQLKIIPKKGVAGGGGWLNVTYMMQGRVLLQSRIERLVVKWYIHM